MLSKYNVPLTFCTVVITILLSGCDTQPAVSSDAPAAASTTMEALRPINTGTPATLFTSLASDQTGIDASCQLDLTHPMKRLYHSGFVCGGIAIGDLDGDNRPDIFFANGPDKNRLFFQKAPLQFEEYVPETPESSIDGGENWAAGVTLADVDNDRDLDIYVCNYDRPNQLFLNEGNRKFREAAAEAGLDLVDACLNPAFCDYDRDGDLDVYVLTNRYYRDGGRPRKPPVGYINRVPYVLPEYSKYYALTKKPNGGYDIDNAGRGDYFLTNNGDGTFTDAREQVQSVGKGHGLSVTWWDYNHDGWPDVYVGNDFNDPDYLLHNNGDGTFSNALKQVIPHTSWFSMGADFGDLNGDGLFDFLVADMSATTHYGQKTTMGAMNAEKMAQVAGPPPQIMKNALYVNSGTSRFLEGAELAGLADSDWTWAIKLADFDNDGRNDVFITNGMARSFTHSDSTTRPEQLIGNTEWDLHENEPTRPEKNRAFQNLGELQFKDVGESWGLEKISMSYAAAYSDLDRDGDLDLIVANLEEPVSVYRNDSPNGNRLVVSLRGNRSNSHGIGATVELATNQGKQVRMLSPQTGFLAGNEPVVHFGLGESTPERLTIRWPSGTTQTIDEISPNILMTINEPEATDKPNPALAILGQPSNNERLYEPVELPIAAEHSETIYDDFATQPLLPNKLSQLGPAIAVADIDGDGDEDFFQGAARGFTGKLMVNQGNGKFNSTTPDAFIADQDCEDMGAVWFDIDSDGDQDLYVASGGVEAGEDTEWYQDRIYLNDGQGNLTKSSNLLPTITSSGSSVAAADFDRDGDLDVFVGARVVPGKYPVTPESRLLENQNGRLVDATDEKAASLLNAGMVTGCVWSDVNNDGWIDLMVAVEWGPIRYFENQQGKLVEQTDAAGLAPHTGWWNGIASRDLDNDGDVDFVVTNFGLNTKYHASAVKPVMLYYGDFSGDGQYRLIEAEFEEQQLFPVRGKSCSTHAMPHLAEKFKTYHDFALASLEDIYTPQCLEDATKMEATTLESGVFLNSGDGKFEFQPLPRLAQISPAFGVVLTDVNHDGNADAYIAQNFFTAQAETGRMDGGLSLLLLGKGDGTFAPISPGKSGLIVAQDAMSLAQCEITDDQFGFVVGVNDDLTQAFSPTEKSSIPQRLLVQLEGPKGNPTAVGAQVSIKTTRGSQSAEVTAGSGYLSQSSATLSFGVPTGQQIETIHVRWPNGKSTTHKADLSRPRQRLKFTE